MARSKNCINTLTTTTCLASGQAMHYSDHVPMYQKPSRQTTFLRHIHLQSQCRWHDLLPQARTGRRGNLQRSPKTSVPQHAAGFPRVLTERAPEPGPWAIKECVCCKSIHRRWPRAHHKVPHQAAVQGHLDNSIAPRGLPAVACPKIGAKQMRGLTRRCTESFATSPACPILPVFLKK